MEAHKGWQIRAYRMATAPTYPTPFMALACREEATRTVGVNAEGRTIEAAIQLVKRRIEQRVARR